VATAWSAGVGPDARTPPLSASGSDILRTAVSSLLVAYPSRRSIMICIDSGVSGGEPGPWSEEDCAKDIVIRRRRRGGRGLKV
jgi:hypothetical protein